MKLLFRLIIVLVILIIFVFWLTILSSSHNIKIEMKIIPFLIILILLFSLFYKKILKKKTT